MWIETLILQALTWKPYFRFHLPWAHWIALTVGSQARPYVIPSHLWWDDKVRYRRY
jgi:hypothetical protein